ncbi:uncharacterized protein LOC129892852 [Solanum dulcamara]|uniref:uncharacterized protein LOC129892852 n=1 Tax=Solanum dulcamara TaxID=45834 RepID=UPI0024852A4F|nr:uncharacterized protein LOC129892852 [Solanum dulcamara]
MVKLNTDGSALHNPGKIGGGELLRNSQGDLIFAYSVPFGEGTNNQSEIMTAIFGLSWYLQLGYTNVILEVDSEMLIRWIKQQAKPSWYTAEMYHPICAEIEAAIWLSMVLSIRFQEGFWKPDGGHTLSHLGAVFSNNLQQLDRD